MTTWNFDGVSAKLVADDGSIVKGRLEKIEFTSEVLGSITAIATLRGAVGTTPFGEYQGTESEENEIAILRKQVERLKPCARILMDWGDHWLWSERQRQSWLNRRVEATSALERGDFGPFVKYELDL